MYVDACSYAPYEGGLRMGASSLDLSSIQERGKQDLASGGVKVRLYTGYESPTVLREVRNGCIKTFHRLMALRIGT